MNHVSYLRVSVLFIWSFNQGFRDNYIDIFCKFLYIDVLKQMSKKTLKSCIFFTTRTFNSNTMCGQASTLEAKDSCYCRESLENC